MASRIRFRPVEPLAARGEILGFLLIAFTLTGCVSLPTRPNSPRALQQVAMEALTRGVVYRDNPAVRVGAVEGLQEGAPEEGLVRLRAALLDAHPGVRFAGCVALGTIEDAGSIDALSGRLADDDASVRAAAMFALHRLGRTEHTGELIDFLLTHSDPLVRCNAAMLLGRLGIPTAAAPLARAMRDKDVRVQDQVLEAMTLLNVPEAKTQMVFLANSGIGAQESFAVLALGTAAPTEHEELLDAKLRGAPHLETRLAAAAGLGRLGRRDGLALAIEALRFNAPRRDDPMDDPRSQITRVRLLAIRALAAIGDESALPALRRVLLEKDDPRLQVAAAGAILKTLHHGAAAVPASTHGRGAP